jgi:glycosyltransferase involved in cell wall biosynthesis
MDDHVSDHPNGSSPLRIAMLVPPWYELPPAGYGGLEQMCAALVDALVAQGHQVTVFGAGRRSGTAAEFVSTIATTQHPRLGEGMPELLHVTRANRLIEEHRADVIHDHTGAGLLTAANRSAPTVATVHNNPAGEIGDFLAGVDPSVGLVAISSAQRRLRTDLPWTATVHNGLALDPALPGQDTVPRTSGGSPAAAPNGQSHGRVAAASNGQSSGLPTGQSGSAPNVREAAPATDDRPVLWLARFSPDKGPDLAIQACRAARLPLVLAGKCTEPSEQRYLREVIAPMLGPDTELVLNADRRRVRRLLRDARCLLMSIRWQEPFGMVMVEAMAEGTPVVAMDRGAVREVVRPSVSGLICAEPDELPDALRQVTRIDPHACMQHVRQHFSADLMARRYTRVYRSVMNSTLHHPARVLANVGSGARL